LIIEQLALLFVVGGILLVAKSLNDGGFKKTDMSLKIKD